MDKLFGIVFLDDTFEFLSNYREEALRKNPF